MGRILDEYRRKRKAATVYREHVRSMSSDALAKEHREKLKRLQVLGRMGSAIDSELARSIRDQVHTLSDEIRHRACRGEMDERTRREILSGRL